jgi:HEAT repeat protein
MIDQGAYTAIINLSLTSSRMVKSDCASALCNLCCESGSEYKAVKEGTPYALVQIASICPENTLSCLTALLNISCVTEKFPRVEEVTEALLHFTTGLSEEEEIVWISALCNLSSLRNNQLRLVEDGILRVVERVMKSLSVPLRSIASKILRNLTTDSRTRGKLMDQSVLSTLMNMARDDEETVRMSCVYAFYNLSRDNACREKIVGSNAVSVLIRMSIEKMSNVDMGRIASKTLRILCGDKVLANKLVGDGIIKALMSLIRTDDGTIRQYCAESICSLFQNESVLSRLIEQGAVNVLVSLSQSDSVDTITSEWCAFALFQLSTNDLCPVFLLVNGILPSLITLCKSQGQGNRTRKFCAAALWSLTNKKTRDHQSQSQSQSFRSSVDVSSAIPILVDMLRNEVSESIKVDCASALYNLADDDANCDQMLQVGALIPVVNLTQADYLQTKIKCAAILSRLSCHEKYYKEFASERVLKVLLELSRLEHALTQRRVIIAVSNLSQLPELRKILLQLEATEYIISLASKPDEQIRRGCAAIICNLSSEDGSEKRMIEAGVVSTLLITALVTSDQVDTKLICAKALVNLMYDPQSYAKMVKEGVIWGLGNLTLLDNPLILNMCAKALCNLSGTGTYARQMLSSPSTVSSIMKLLTQKENGSPSPSGSPSGSADVELQRYSGRILTNLLLQTTDSDEEFRREAVKNMFVMSTCQDKEVSELCIYCLCLASQSESCRTTIVSSGVLSNIDVSSIFNDPSVSYAYLTMFGNIANNPAMRTQVLDGHGQSVNRFLTICMSNSRTRNFDLDSAVLNALYCLSCAEENLAKLCKQNSLDIIRLIWNSHSEAKADASASASASPACSQSHGFLHHMVAYLFNLTTDPAIHSQLVSQGIVRIFHNLWGEAKQKSSVTAYLTVAAISQLASGSVNTNQMVREGCADILCYPAQCIATPVPLSSTSASSHSSLPTTSASAAVSSAAVAASSAAPLPTAAVSSSASASASSHIHSLHLTDSASGVNLFDQNILERCSAAFRNLSISIPNQQPLVSAGSIDALVKLGTPTREYDLYSQEFLRTRKNCASALRSMTFNPIFQAKLAKPEVISIILEDLTSSFRPEELNVFEKNLLTELETESWRNGSRGQQKETRAVAMISLPLYTHLLGGISNVSLTVERDPQSVNQQKKYLVKVQLEEPPIETSDSHEALEDGFQNLASYSDDEGGVGGAVMIYPDSVLYGKMECVAPSGSTGKGSGGTTKRQSKRHELILTQRDRYETETERDSAEEAQAEDETETESEVPPPSLALLSCPNSSLPFLLCVSTTSE